MYRQTEYKKTGQQKAFYWIDNDELVVCESNADSSFKSHADLFIWIRKGMYICTDRIGFAKTSLINDHWSGMKQGIDGYPNQKSGGYLISGSDTEWFKA